MIRKTSKATILLLLVLFAAGAALGEQRVVYPGEFLVAVLPNVGSTPGGFDSYWKTAVQVHNASPVPLQFRLVFHPAGRSGSAGDPSGSVTVGPFATIYYADVLPAMGVATGIGSLDVFLPNGSAGAALAVSRVFNDAGEAGTSGFTEDFVALDDFLVPGQPGYLIVAPDLAVYRFNVGVRTLDTGASLTVTVRDPNGVVTATVTKTYAVNYSEQVTLGTFLAGAAVSGSESLTIAVTSGSAFVYGTTVDNRTNDASFQRAEKLVD